MGGPGASVLLRNPLTEQQKDELDTWLHAMTRTLEGDILNGYSFWLKEDAVSTTVSSCLFYLGIDNLADQIEGDERQQLRELLGYVPEQTISVSSGCNQDSDHRTLGLLVLHLAEFYHGLVNMGGAILPPRQSMPIRKDFPMEQLSSMEKRRAYVQAQFNALEATLPPGTTLLDWYKERIKTVDSPFTKRATDMKETFGPILPPRTEPSFEEITAYLQEMPGQIYEIYYETGRKTRWVYHIVDTTFLRAWLTHPHFYMIK